MINLIRPRRIHTLTILLILLTIAFYDVVFLGKTFKVTTANSQILPTGVYGQELNKPPFIPVNGTDSPVLEETIYQFLRHNLWNGTLPLWNPHQATGYPLIGMIQVGIFFPLNFIMYLFPSFISWDLLIFVRLLLAGFFTAWFMRVMGFKPIPCLCAGIAFMLSGPMLLLQYWTANVDILTPVLLIMIHKLTRKPCSKNTAFLSIAIALTIFAGHPEHIFLVNVYGLAFFVYRLVVLRRKILWKKTILLYVCSNVLGMCLSAVALFPFIRNLIFEFWNGHPEGTGLMMEEQAGRALTIALPHFFQKVPLTYRWEFSGWWGGYLGTLPLGLAFISLLNNHKNKLNYFLAALAFLIVSKQYGLPYINWIGYLPIFDKCRYAIHAPALAAFSVAVLAGMGVRTIYLHRNVFYKALIYCGALLSIALAHLFFLRSTETFPVASQATLFAFGLLLLFQLILFLKDRNILQRRFAGWLIVLLLFSELFSYIHRERPRRFDSFPAVPYIEKLNSSPERIRSYGMFWAFYPNSATGYGVDDLGYFFGLVPKRFVHFVNTLLLPNHFRNDLRPPALRAIPLIGREKHPFLDLLNVKYFIGPSEERLSKLLIKFDQIKKSLNMQYSGEATLFERSSAFPRAFVVHRAVFKTGRDVNLELVKRIGHQLREVAVINSPMIPQIQEFLNTSPVNDRSTVQITRYSPNEVEMTAFMEHAGFVVFSDAYHPDWKVSVNGKDWKIFQTNYLIRSVFLPKGVFRLKFSFRPFSFYLGLTVSLVSLIILCGLFVWRAPRSTS